VATPYLVGPILVVYVTMRIPAELSNLSHPKRSFEGNGKLSILAQVIDCVSKSSRASPLTDGDSRRMSVSRGNLLTPRNYPRHASFEI
jgi:hypothetical protein